MSCVFRSVCLTLALAMAACSSKTQYEQPQPFATCHDYVDKREPADSSATDFLVSGTIVQNTSNPHANNDPFKFSSSTITRIELECGNWDSPAVLIARKVIEGLLVLPTDFELRGQLPNFSSYNFCTVSVRIAQKSHEVCIGDLLTESLYFISAPTTGLNIETFGLESYRSQNSGGNCL